MQTINFWHKFHLHGRKVTVVLFALLLFCSHFTYGQLTREINLANSDEKKIKYGFSIGIFSTQYKLKYADVFSTPSFDSVQSINPKRNFGFSLGLIANFRLAEYLDFRVTPKVGFYQNQIEFVYMDRESLTAFTELTRVELPLLFKYKSARRGNTRMYLIAGVNPSIRVSGAKLEEEIDDRIIVQDENFAVEFGFGLDLYYPLFRFSPEIRFSKGLSNILVAGRNDISAGIESLNLNTITLYLQFGD